MNLLARVGRSIRLFVIFSSFCIAANSFAADSSIAFRGGGGGGRVGGDRGGDRGVQFNAGDRRIDNDLNVPRIGNAQQLRDNAELEGYGIQNVEYVNPNPFPDDINQIEQQDLIEYQQEMQLENQNN